MRVRTANRNAKHLSGQNIARRLTAANNRSTRTVDACIRSLRTAKTEFENAVSSSRLNNTGSFGRNQRLVIDNIEQCSFKKLCFHNWRNDADNRFSGKNDRTFRNSQNFAGESKSRELFKKSVIKDFQTPQIGDVIGGKMEVLYIVNRLLKTCRNGISGHITLLAIENIKAGAIFFHAETQITIHHGQFI